MKYYSCKSIENFYFNVNGRIDTDEPCINFCCEPFWKRPGSAFAGTGEQTIREYARLRGDVLEECRRLGDAAPDDERRTLMAGCAKCGYFELRDWPEPDGLIHYVNLSMYPAPCQCGCVYCSVRKSKDNMRFDREEHVGYYEKLMDALEYASGAGMILPSATWQVASGEITIHPFRDRILDLVRDRTARFCTNAFLYNEKIAENLGRNQNSIINLSIDSGTSDTWRKIKGADVCIRRGRG